jgi:hypothetical protein
VVSAFWISNVAIPSSLPGTLTWLMLVRGRIGIEVAEVARDARAAICARLSVVVRELNQEGFVAFPEEVLNDSATLDAREAVFGQVVDDRYGGEQLVSHRCAPFFVADDQPGLEDSSCSIQGRTCLSSMKRPALADAIPCSTAWRNCRSEASEGSLGGSGTSTWRRSAARGVLTRGVHACAREGGHLGETIEQADTD